MDLKFEITENGLIVTDKNTLRTVTFENDDIVNRFICATYDETHYKQLTLDLIRYVDAKYGYWAWDVLCPNIGLVARGGTQMTSDERYEIVRFLLENF